MEEKNRSNVEVFDRFGEMKRLLEENDLPCRDDELADYLQMFDVISELIQGQLDTEAMVGCFAALAPVMKDPEIRTSRDKMKKMFAMLEELPDRYLLCFMKKEYSPEVMQKLKDYCTKLYREETGIVSP